MNFLKKYSNAIDIISITIIFILCFWAGYEAGIHAFVGNNAIDFCRNLLFP